MALESGNVGGCDSAMARGLSNYFLLFIGLVGCLGSVSQAQSELPFCPEALETGLVEGNGMYFSINEFDASRYPQTWIILPAYIKRLSEAMQTHNATLVVATLPHRALVHGDFLSAQDLLQPFDVAQAQASYWSYVSTLQAQGVFAVDLLTPALELANRERFYQNTDGHWTSAAAQVSAQSISDYIKANSSFYENLPKKEFQIDFEREDSMEEPSYATLVEEACGVKIEEEKFKRYKTTAVTSQGLFDEETPAVILLGSSFSGPKFNFAGFLSEALRSDVQNNYVAGGGPFASLQDFLLSERYLDQEPKLVIWQDQINRIGATEINFKGHIAEFRQAIPAAYGDCAQEATPLMEVTSEVEANSEAVVLENSDNLPVVGLDYYLVFEVADLTATEFQVLVEYQDGSSDTVAIERSTRTPNTGKFFLELLDASAPLANVSMLGLPQPTTLTARVCQRN
jgi:alginate biosynthesis protein AlgX